MPKLRDPHPEHDDFVFWSIHQGQLVWRGPGGELRTDAEMGARDESQAGNDFEPNLEDDADMAPDLDADADLDASPGEDEAE